MESHSDRTDKGQHQHTCSFLNSGMGGRLKKNGCALYYSNIFSYFVDSVAFDSKEISNLKNLEAYKYLHNNKVSHVLFKDV